MTIRMISFGSSVMVEAGAQKPPRVRIEPRGADASLAVLVQTRRGCAYLLDGRWDHRSLTSLNSCLNGVRERT